MVESTEAKYEIDPLEVSHLKDTIKPVRDDQISLHTKPSSSVESPKGGLDKFICYFCKSIVIDPVSE